VFIVTEMLLKVTANTVYYTIKMHTVVPRISLLVFKVKTLVATQIWYTKEPFLTTNYINIIYNIFVYSDIKNAFKQRVSYFNQI